MPNLLIASDERGNAELTALFVQPRMDTDKHGCGNALAAATTRWIRPSPSMGPQRRNPMLGETPNRANETGRAPLNPTVLPRPCILRACLGSPSIPGPVAQELEASPRHPNASHQAQSRQ